MDAQRLDLLLIEKGLIAGRERAKTAIEDGIVFVNGRACIKPGARFDMNSEIEVRGEVCPYVSRGGLKLERALDYFKIDPAGLVCADIGASTGGFTDCLLRRGAALVYAVDVGHGQLAERIRIHPDVVVMEGFNIRGAGPEHFERLANLAVIDVSFISLDLVIPAVYNITDDRGEAVCLIKPQFEAGRAKLSKRGVVKDPAVHIDVLSKVRENVENAGFYLKDITHSPITGAEGNIEFLAHLTKAMPKCYNYDLTDIVVRAHKIL